jgi:hypothetical protein
MVLVLSSIAFLARPADMGSLVIEVVLTRSSYVMDVVLTRATSRHGSGADTGHGMIAKVLTRATA